MARLRATLLGVVVIVLAVTSVAIWRASRDAPSASPQPVVWNATPASGSPAAAVQPGTPKAACRESGFTGVGGHSRAVPHWGVDIRVRLVYHDSTPCFISAFGPWVQLTDSSGQVLGRGGQGGMDTFTPYRYAVRRGDVVLAHIRWNEWCDPGSGSVSEVRLRFIDGGGFNNSGPYDDAHSALVRLSGTPHPDCPGSRWSGRWSDLTTFPPVVAAGSSPESLSVTINAPAQTPRGSILDYTVRMTNDGEQPVSFDPCPAIGQTLTADDNGKWLLSSTTRLNCRLTGIAAHHSVVFRMRLQLPSAHRGGTILHWYWLAQPHDDGDEQSLELG